MASDTLKALKKKYSDEKISGWDMLPRSEEKILKETAEKYMAFLDEARTERLAVEYVLTQAKRKGYKPLEGAKELKPGGKFYSVNSGKNIALIRVGKKPVLKGVNLIASHIDAPRIDVKQNPLYEDSHLALFKTHYYGGIKKYHWLNIPLALHGTVILQDGSSVKIDMGMKETDPVLVISDLLPHLARKAQGGKKIFEGIAGEQLNLIVGSKPIKTSAKDRKSSDRIKMAVLSILNNKYGIVEQDFNSAELELTPALKTRNAGLDGSLIAGYGQDDRICSFCSMEANFSVSDSDRTSISFMADKEETGSMGMTGMRSWFFIRILGEMLELQEKKYTDNHLRKALAASMALSADVDAGVNPTFKEVYDMHNSAFMGYGVVMTKYTGHGGKYNANDANAEYVGKIRKIMNKEKIPFQFAELGKVDEGGGGTVAMYLANLGMEIIDCGPGILGMHSPYEISSKIDLYYTVKTYEAFLSKMK